MITNLNALICDEAGFVVSAELVLIATISVLGVIIGLSQVSNSVNHELADVGNAFSALQQHNRFTRGTSNSIDFPMRER